MATATRPPKPESLVTKLSHIAASVTSVEKKGYNDHHKYAYVREPELFEAVRGGLADAGIMLLPCVTGITRDHGLVTLAITFRLHDGATGESLEIPWYAEGQDSADKGINKALTAGMKYLIYKLFLIPTTTDAGEYTDAENTRFSPVTAPTIVVPQPDTAGASMSGQTRIRAVDVKSGINKNGNKWTKYNLTFGNGVQAGFFSPDYKNPDTEEWGKLAERAQQALAESDGKESVKVIVDTQPSNNPAYKDIIALDEIADSQPPADTTPQAAVAPDVNTIPDEDEIPF